MVEGETTIILKPKGESGKNRESSAAFVLYLVFYDRRRRRRLILSMIAVRFESKFQSIFSRQSRRTSKQKKFRIKNIDSDLRGLRT